MIQDNDHYWDIFTRKDARYDGLFFVGVMSTKIYCRPTCSARPARKNVRFFATIHDAESAGLRPCKRCTPHTLAPDKQLCELVCRIIEQSAQAPDLASIATLTGYSKFHLLRTFKRIMGITPFAYTQIVRSLRFHQNMTQITSVTDALLDAGYGSPSAYYYAQKHARNLTIITTSDTYVIGHCRYAGFDVVGVFNERGVVYCGIYSDMTSAEAEFRTRHGIDVTVIDQAYSNLLHALIHRQALEQPVALISDAATPFQRDVWHVIRDIPEGETLSYRALAERIGRPTAIRAVANACAQNQHAVITPCHRIIGADHNPGGYRWGTSLKSALLTYERANYYNERSDN